MDLRLLYFLLLLGLVQSEMLNLKCDLLKKFVNGHNTRRLRLARGQVSGQPAAAKMNKTIWDEELAKKAYDWCSKNKYGHNPDKTIPSKRFPVGENIYKFSTTSTSFHFDPEKTMTAWFEEHKKMKYKKLEPSDFAKDKPKIGHYTQMAWANTIFIGCAISRFNENKNGKKYVSYYVVCNYGPAGNVIGQAPYERGRASRSRTLKCTAGSACDRPFGLSCS